MPGKKPDAKTTEPTTATKPGADKKAEPKKGGKK